MPQLGNSCPVQAPKINLCPPAAVMETWCSFHFGLHAPLGVLFSILLSSLPPTTSFFSLRFPISILFFSAQNNRFLQYTHIHSQPSQLTAANPWDTFHMGHTSLATRLLYPELVPSQQSSVATVLPGQKHRLLI